LQATAVLGTQWTVVGSHLQLGVLSDVFFRRW